MDRAPTPPSDLLPSDHAVVTTPPAFSWTPGENNDAIYLNVSTTPDVDPIDVINWADDGSHYYCAEDTGAFQALKGKTLFWRLAVDCCGERVWTPTRSFTVGDISLDPYYNLVHMQNVKFPAGKTWDPSNLDSIDAKDLTAIKSYVGSGGRTPDRKLGFSLEVSYFYNTVDHLKKLLAKLIEVAEEADMPILFGLDGFEWWRGRPDLWNWWDPQHPGYNPNNKLNVEWTSWSPEDAVREGWRNWGFPILMKEPHPNLTSPAVIQANQDTLKEAAPIIKSWHDGLPYSKRYLFAGVKVGWEVNIGWNYYYPFPDGDNSQPENGRQVGYAAVKTAGIRFSGQLTQEDLTRAVQIYMTELSKTLYEAGIPRRKIFTHVGAQSPDYHPTLVFTMTDAALNEFAHPGWSFYTGQAGPKGIGGLDASLDKIAASSWGNVEWGGAGEGLWWRTLLNQFQRYRHNKLVNTFNTLDTAHANGLRAVIDRLPFWMHPPVVHTEIRGRTALLSWSVPSQAYETYLNVTTNPQLDVHGAFKTTNVVNERVTGTNSFALHNLAPGTYYWKLFADRDGRRVASDLAMFTVANVPVASMMLLGYP